MKVNNKIDCRDLIFSPDLSSNRLSKAKLIFGEKVLERMIVFCLYILGVQRSAISRAVGLPENTVRTMIKKILNNGFVAFVNRAGKEFNIFKNYNKKSASKADSAEIHELSDKYQITINQADIFISKSNRQQFKAILLTLAENGFVSNTEIGKLLDISSSHVGYLIKKVSENDLISLIDKRRGQQKDYVFTPEVKSELIVQFAVNAATGKSTSSPVLTNDLEQRTSYKLSERSIRYQINNLGLKGKAVQLWELIGLKKTS